MTGSTLRLSVMFLPFSAVQMGLAYGATAIAARSSTGSARPVPAPGRGQGGH